MFMMAAPAMVAPSFAPASTGSVAPAGNDTDIRKFIEFMQMLKAYENSKAANVGSAAASGGCAPAAGGVAPAAVSAQGVDTCQDLRQLQRDVNDLKDVTRDLTRAVDAIVKRLENKQLLD
jgi:hypothetical protein